LLEDEEERARLERLRLALEAEDALERERLEKLRLKQLEE
jgi:hypothetical protein